MSQCLLKEQLILLFNFLPVSLIFFQIKKIYKKKHEISKKKKKRNNKINEICVPKKNETKKTTFLQMLGMF